MDAIRPRFCSPEALADLRAAGEGWLTPGRPVTLAAAPGRLDVMGGIADYSGAVVLEATIGDLAVVALQPRDDDRLRVRTVGPETARVTRTEFGLRTSDFYEQGGPQGRLKPYAAASALFAPDVRWAAYVLGVFYVLLAEGGLPGLPHGADVVLRSAVPLGAGVASSAAVEVATMRAVAAAYGAPAGGVRLAELCQIVENRVVGAPCGIMDQVTCALGREGQLLALRCRPHDVLGWYAPPDGYAFAGLDSGVKHAVGGSRYTRVRCAAFMGRRMIQAHLATHGEDAARATYLCNLSAAEYRARFRAILPATIGGREFLERWGETGDTATAVLPDERYPVRGATEHAIYENERVHRFIQALERARAELGKTQPRRGTAVAAMRAAGRLMYGSHRSYSRNCGLGSRETDRLVSLVRREGPAGGLWGAKITGGGSGGTVAVLLEAGDQGVGARAAAALERVRRAYAQEVGWEPRLLVGSQDGAEAIAPATITWSRWISGGWPGG